MTSLDPHRLLDPPRYPDHGYALLADRIRRRQRVTRFRQRGVFRKWIQYAAGRFGMHSGDDIDVAQRIRDRASACGFIHQVRVELRRFGERKDIRDRGLSPALAIQPGLT